MELIDPNTISLLPGQSVEGMFVHEPDGEPRVGLFLRPEHGTGQREKQPEIKQRAGVVHFNDLLLVLTMVKVGGEIQQVFDVWWNYHARGGDERFERMSEQEQLALHFYGEEGKEYSLNVKNNFRKFFASLPNMLKKTKPWSEIEFDRAVRGFCAQSYPRENLWHMMGLKTREARPIKKEITIDDYPGTIPPELKPFYSYVPGQGHCINIIPSMLEDRALEASPDEFLAPAPVRTVLRCGFRWVRGYPVAPIPFIPGHGLAVPPEDAEL